MFPATTFVRPLLVMLAEAFGVGETPNGYFLDTGQSGLMGTINALSAQTASAARTPEEATIAAHCGHILFLLRFFAAFERGETPEADWPGSWQTRVVDERDWDELRRDLQGEYDNLVARLRQRETWPDEAFGASLMLLAHCAYHVGEIRQRLLWVAG
jgi:hypothetical protein